MGRLTNSCSRTVSIILILIFLMTIAFAASSGAKSPTANYAIGTGIDQANRAYSENNSYAHGQNGYTTAYYNYDFNVPIGMQIDGIIVEVNDSYRDSGLGNDANFTVSLSNDGGATWSNELTTPSLPRDSSPHGTYQLGSSTNLWGSTWSSTSFSNSNFRVKLKANFNHQGNSFQAYLDWIPVTVYYSSCTPTTWYEDSDADGYGNASVTQSSCTQPTGYVADDTDCDDTDGAINPEATEVCDGKDNDCDTLIDDDDDSVTDQTTWYLDGDSDLFGHNLPTLACSQPTGFVANDTDCDDEDAAIYPGATEVCNEKDDDCDGTIDNGVQNTYYADSDEDGYGDAATSVEACSAPTGYVEDSSDCDDTVGSCNTDCASVKYADDDSDTYGNADVSTRACDAPAGYVDNSTDCNPENSDAWVIVSGYIDNDLDSFGSGAIDACTNGTLPAGYSSTDDDCDDADDAINPEATEVCDGKDNDCDGSADDADTFVFDPLTWYLDSDADYFGTTESKLACSQPEGYVDNSTDNCPSVSNIDQADNDADAIGNVCDNCPNLSNVDQVDSDADLLGDGCDNCPSVSNVDQADDDADGIGNACDEYNCSTTNGGVETCDGIDNDCDGTIDEDLTRSTENTYGMCSANIQVCSDGTWIDDEANYTPSEEVCDNQDNDCDDVVDEDLTRATENTNGLCSENAQTCSAGNWYDNETNYLPVTEVWNNETDEDCDGYSQYDTVPPEMVDLNATKDVRDVLLEFSATDVEGSGVKGFYVSNGGTDWTYTTNTSLAYLDLANGTYTFFVKAVDNADNNSADKNVVVTISVRGTRTVGGGGTTPTCQSYTYSDWSTCSASGQQTRTVVSSLPAGCLARDNLPVLTQACTPANTNPTTPTNPNTTGPTTPETVEGGNGNPNGNTPTTEGTLPTEETTGNGQPTGPTGLFGLGDIGGFPIAGLGFLALILLIGGLFIFFNRRN